MDESTDSSFSVRTRPSSVQFNLDESIGFIMNDMKQRKEEKEKAKEESTNLKSTNPIKTSKSQLLISILKSGDKLGRRKKNLKDSSKEKENGTETKQSILKSSDESNRVSIIDSSGKGVSMVSSSMGNGGTMGGTIGNDGEGGASSISSEKKDGPEKVSRVSRNRASLLYGAGGMQEAFKEVLGGLSGKVTSFFRKSSKEEAGAAAILVGSGRESLNLGVPPPLGGGGAGESTGRRESLKRSSISSSSGDRRGSFTSSDPRATISSVALPTGMREEIDRGLRENTLPHYDGFGFFESALLEEKILLGKDRNNILEQSINILELSKHSNDGDNDNSKGRVSLNSSDGTTKRVSFVETNITQRSSDGFFKRISSGKSSSRRMSKRLAQKNATKDMVFEFGYTKRPSVQEIRKSMGQIDGGKMIDLKHTNEDDSKYNDDKEFKETNKKFTRIFVEGEEGVTNIDALKKQLNKQDSVVESEMGDESLSISQIKQKIAAEYEYTTDSKDTGSSSNDILDPRNPKSPLYYIPGSHNRPHLSADAFRIYNQMMAQFGDDKLQTENKSLCPTGQLNYLSYVNGFFGGLEPKVYRLRRFWSNLTCMYELGCPSPEAFLSEQHCMIGEIKADRELKRTVLADLLNEDGFHPEDLSDLVQIPHSLGGMISRFPLLEHLGLQNRAQNNMQLVVETFGEQIVNTLTKMLGKIGCDISWLQSELKQQEKAIEHRYDGFLLNPTLHFPLLTPTFLGGDGMQFSLYRPLLDGSFDVTITRTRKPGIFNSNKPGSALIMSGIGAMAAAPSKSRIFCFGCKRRLMFEGDDKKSLKIADKITQVQPGAKWIYPGLPGRLGPYLENFLNAGGSVDGLRRSSKYAASAHKREYHHDPIRLEDESPPHSDSDGDDANGMFGGVYMPSRHVTVPQQVELEKDKLNHGIISTWAKWKFFLTERTGKVVDTLRNPLTVYADSIDVIRADDHRRRSGYQHTLMRDIADPQLHRARKKKKPISSIHDLHHKKPKIVGRKSRKKKGKQKEDEEDKKLSSEDEGDKKNEFSEKEYDDRTHDRVTRLDKLKSLSVLEIVGHQSDAKRTLEWYQMRPSSVMLDLLDDAIRKNENEQNKIENKIENKIASSREESSSRTEIHQDEELLAENMRQVWQIEKERMEHLEKIKEIAKRRSNGSAAGGVREEEKKETDDEIEKAEALSFCR